MIVVGHTPQPDAAFKILTPWWDVLTRYLTAGIMTIALTTTALQATKDNLVCSPAVNCSPNEGPVTSTAPYKDVCNKVHFRLNDHSITTTITTMADIRQYNFLDALCFHEGVDQQWYPVYFPFILVAEALVLLLIDNFWIMYPKTSSALNHFITLTMECYGSVETHLDLFQMLSKPKKAVEVKSPPDLHLEVDINHGAQSLLLESKEETTEAAPPKPVDEKPEFQLDISDAMKVKILFEKVGEFKDQYGRNNMLLTKVYRIRAAFQTLLCISSLAFHLYNLNLLEDIVKCKLPKQVFVTHYQFFLCARFIAPYYRAVTLIFAAAVSVYLITIAYAFIWSVRNAKRVNVFTDVAIANDKVHMGGDLAFLFSLLEQYNKLYCDRLAVFLSKGLKIKLDKKISKTLHEASLRKKSIVKYN